MTTECPNASASSLPVGVPVPAAAQDLRDPGTASQCMQLRLQLRREHPAAPWSAELAVPGAGGRLTFPTLDALARWLARLDRPRAGLR